MPNPNSPRELQNSVDRQIKASLKADVTPQMEWAVKAAVTPIEASIQRAEKYIGDKFDLLRTEFEKVSRKLGDFKK